MRSPFRRATVAVVVVTALATSTACMGQFVLTKGLYNWNSSLTGSKAVNNVVFWALGILPVYSLAVAGDLFIFNVIEFWTGKNIIAGNDSPDGSRVVQNDDGSLTITRDGAVYVATPTGPRSASVRRDGALLGSIEALGDGSVVVTGADGVDVTVLTPEEVGAISPAVAALAAAR